MKKLAIAFFLLLPVGTIFAQTNLSVLNSVKLFTDFVSNNKLISDSRWVDPNDAERIWNGATVFINKQILNIDYTNYKLKGHNRFLENGEWHSIILRYLPLDQDNQLDYSVAEHIYQEILQTFNKPARILDYGFLSNSSIRQTFTAQWEKNSYLIDLRIMDLGNFVDKPSIAGMFLQICKIGTYSNVFPLLGIKATVKSGMYWNPFDNYWYQFPYTTFLNWDPDLFILDYNEKKILDPSYAKIGEIEKFTNLQTTIIFYNYYSPTKSTYLWRRFILDRNSGNFNIIEYQPNGREMKKYAGSAEHWDFINRQKF